MSVVEEAKLPGVFSLDKFLVDVAYPEETVTVFTDAFSVNELMKLRDQYAEVEAKQAALNEERRNKRDKFKKSQQRTVAGNEEYKEEPTITKLDEELGNKLIALQDKIDQLDESVAASGLTIKLRGMAPGIVDTVSKKHFTDANKDYSNTPEEEERDYELIALSIVSMSDSEGNIDTAAVTVEQVKKLRSSLLPGEYAHLVQAVAMVNLNGALFDQATDASFLSRRTNLAG